MADKAGNITAYPAETTGAIQSGTLTVYRPGFHTEQSGSGSAKGSFIARAWYRITNWETWDWRIKYILIGPAWFWFCLRARSPWFFSASNPTLTFGGFDGESKKEIYDQLPPDTYPESICIDPRTSFAAVEQMLAKTNLIFPMAVKPNVGKMGFLFRRIKTREELENYHKVIPCEYIIQKFVDYPLELSVFYYRMPDAAKGVITGFIRKEFLEVMGDGKSTLWELILNYPRVQFRLDEMKAKHRKYLDTILKTGEQYCLSPALNLSRGGRLVSLEEEKDDRLVKVFDQLSHYTGTFYYGRYDIKCRSIEDLKAGVHFSILEYNGSGAEPHHVYGNGYTLSEACVILVRHWAVLYKISRMNHRRGVPYWDLMRGWKFIRQAASHAERLRNLDRKLPLT